MTRHTSCPYFQPDRDDQCRMTRGGLYLPLLAHTEIFCKTERYCTCRQYLRGMQLMESVQATPEAADLRRKFRRQPSRIPLILSLCDSKGIPVSLIDDDARTTDLSVGGLGLLSRKPIEAHKIIHFQLSPPGLGVPLAGIGEIRWAHKLEGDDGYQAGLSFVDSTSSSRLRQHFPLS
ncbi:MAG: PilZ domain-containing protein [Thermodesulfobacteriota bacterium]